MRKQTLILVVLILSSLLVVGFTRGYVNKTNSIVSEIEAKPIKEFEIKLNISNFIIDETDLFLDAIGHYESTNRYNVTNRFGYMGKYQFGKRTLKNLGYNVTKTEFLNSPELQEQAMLDLLEHNKQILQPYIDYWDGKKINGKVITESGILAAAHLAGPSNVKKYLKHGEDFKDGNGTKLTRYLTHFSGYELNLD